MLLKTSPITILFLINTVFSRPQNVALQDNVDYTQNFVTGRGGRTQGKSQIEQVDTDKLKNDPFLRELFNEFLVQYQEIAQSQQNLEATVQTTTQSPIIPSQLPFTLSSPNPQVIHPPPQRQPVPSANLAPENFPQKRRGGPRRKTNTPQASRRISSVQPVISTTPFSHLLGHINFPHHVQEEVTTAFPSLRAKYFGIKSDNPSKTSPRHHQNFPHHVQGEVTTPSPPLRSRFFGVDSQPNPTSQRISPKLPENFHFNFPTTPRAPVELPTTPSPPKPVIKVQLPQSVARTTIKVPSTPVKKNLDSDYDEEEFRRQAESAKYEFSSDVNDEINGNLHQREEVRDGLAVRGKYSYSDGYYKRTVHYEADDKGYRVVKEEVEPLEGGPQVNPDGHAKISTYVAGNTNNYQISADDIMKRDQTVSFEGLPEQENGFLDTDNYN